MDAMFAFINEKILSKPTILYKRKVLDIKFATTNLIKFECEIFKLKMLILPSKDTTCFFRNERI